MYPNMYSASIFNCKICSESIFCKFYQRIEGILEMISVVKSDHSTMLIKVITVASKKNDMFAWTSTCIRQPL
jgi:hypothetical protein